MSQLSAADLQKKHALEGTPDPFPSLNGSSRAAGGAHSTGKPKQSRFASGAIDTSSETAFPSLAPTAPKRAAASNAWGASAAPRISRPAVQAPSFTDTFDLGQIDLKAQGRDGKPTTLGEVMRQVMLKSGATIEASTQKTTNRTTFVLKAASERSLDSAKRLLVALLSPMVTKTVDAPVSTIGSIIGTKGAVLREIRDKTTVRIDIPPRRDTGNLSVPVNGDAAHSSRSPSPLATNAEGEEEDEPTVPITVTGPAPLVQEAIGMLQSIINVKTSKTTQRVKDIQAHILPFLVAEKVKIEAKTAKEHPEALLTFTVHEKLGEIVCYGDRVVVVPAIGALKEAKEELGETLKHVTVSIPMNQHRFVLGHKAAEEFMSEHQVVVMPPDAGEGITIWGIDNLGNALTAVLAKSSSQHVQTVTLPGTPEKANQIQTYIHRTSYLKLFHAAHPNVTVHVSSSSEIEKTGQILIDFVGDRDPVRAAVKEFKGFVKKVEDGLKEVEVDWLLHRSLIGKHGNKIKQFQEAHNVILFFPPEASEMSTVLLVHDPLSSEGNITAAAKQKHLDNVTQEIKKLAGEAADVKTETITIDKKWHSAIVGKNGSTLNSIIGEDNMLSIKVGSQARVAPGKEPLADDDIRIRGPSADVDRAIKEIYVIAEQAKQDEIESSYVTEFDISQDYVGRVVGAQGATVNRLRETLGVRIDFVDDVDDKEWTETSKGKKSSPRVHIKITGRKENAREAKKRILAQVDQLADETQESVHILREYHSALIGPSGKYVNRMEEQHGVKIFFPRDQHNAAENGDSGRGRDGAKPNEVTIKGGRKGVASAKAELLEIVEYEKSNNIVLKFAVPTRSVRRILGKGGVSINQIKSKTGAQIDVEKEESSPGVSAVSVRGTVQETEDAKAAILAIANEVDDEYTEIVMIEAKYHRTFIGKGGEALKQLIISAGGPEDPKLQAGLIHFPRYGEPEDEVRLRGEKKLVAKLKSELEKMASTQRDRVILGVGIPASHHRVLIGRGGQHLNDLQARTGTQIWFPGSRAYASVGDEDNADELSGVTAEDLVKVVGSKAACQAAIADLIVKAASASQPRPERSAGPGSVTKTVTVPAKYHHAILQGGNFNRSLRYLGVFVDFSRVPQEFAPVRPVKGGAAIARIDQDEEPVTEGVEWTTIPNYAGAEEGDLEWTFRGRDEESLTSVEGALKTAIEQAESATHVGFLTLADRSAFPRIVGTKGANVSRVRHETGTDITVGKGDNTIIIVGSEAGIEEAKHAILQTADSSDRRGPHRNDRS